MALTIDEVRRIAALARLRLSPEEEQAFTSQLGRVVDYIDQLARFETLAEGDARTGREAPDVVAECLPLAEFLRNAPQTWESFLVVPAIKGDDG